MKNDEDAAAEVDAEDGAKKGNSSKKKSKDFVSVTLSIGSVMYFCVTHRVFCCASGVWCNLA